MKLVSVLVVAVAIGLIFGVLFLLGVSPIDMFAVFLRIPTVYQGIIVVVGLSFIVIAIIGDRRDEP